MQIPKPRHSIESSEELRDLYLDRYYGPPLGIVSSDYPGLFYQCACCNLLILLDQQVLFLNVRIIL